MWTRGGARELPNREEKMKRLKAMRIVFKAKSNLDEQQAPWNEKKYIPTEEEALDLLDAGADIVSYGPISGGKFLLQMMYEGIPFEFTAAYSLRHPRLSNQKAG